MRTITEQKEFAEIKEMLEGEQKIYQLNIDPLYLQVANSNHYGRYCWISGNTIGINNQFLKNQRYPELIYGAADTVFTYNIKDKLETFVLMDQFNVIASRSGDVTNHTWRISVDELKDKMLPHCNLTLDDIFI